MYPVDYAQKLLSEIKTLESEKKDLYHDIIKSMLDKQHIDATHIDEEDANLTSMILEMYRYGYLSVEQKNEILILLQDLHIYLSKFLRTDGEYDVLKNIIGDIETHLQHQASYLMYSPGGRNGEYVRLADIVSLKTMVLYGQEATYKNGTIFYAGRPIQGLTITTSLFSRTVKLRAEHYSSEFAARQICQRNIIDGGVDQDNQYCFFSEIGKLASKSEDEIKKLLGAKSADSFVAVNIVVPVDHVWIKLRTGYPAKFAIESRLVPVSVAKLVVNGKERVF